MIDRRLILGATLAGVFGVVVLAVAAGGMWAGWGIPGFAAVWGVGFCSMGFVIDRSKPGHPVGRKLLWMGPLAAANELVIGSLRFDVAWVGYLAPLTSLFVLFLSLLLHALAVFPDGAWAFPWARVGVAALWLTAIASMVISFLAQPVGDVDIESAYPVVLPPVAADAALVVWNISTLAIAVGVVWAFFTAEGPYRRQFGWLAFSVFVAAFFAMAASIFRDSEVLPVIATVAVLGIPVSIAVAVTRYRLYEIDRIVSRTVSYVLVIGFLAGAYGLLVLGLRSLFPVEGPLPVALSTLAVAFAFFPLARRMQGFVDRRFFRGRYDAAVVVAAFADELRTTLDPSVAAGRAESVVAETFQAESVAVWLAEEPA